MMGGVQGDEVTCAINAFHKATPDLIPCRATQSKPEPQNSALKQSEDGFNEAERGEEEASPSTVFSEPQQVSLQNSSA